MFSGKWMYSILAGILFAVFASPYMYSLTQRLIGDPLKQVFIRGNGFPTPLGLAVHGALYALVVRFLME